MTLASQIRSLLIFDNGDLAQAVHSWRYECPVVADVETFTTDPKNGKLLGVALCSVEHPTEPIYVVLQWYDYKTSTWKVSPKYRELCTFLRAYLSEVTLVGHNFAYDKSWLDHVLQIDTKWKACTRLMWHMAAAPAGPRPYGLKDAQVELLGWEKRGSDDLEAQVVARGGKLKEGGHYLADVDVMGRYACLDGGSTALLFNHLSQFFDRNDYWWMMDKMVEYSWLLQICTTAGIRVDVDALENQIQVLTDTREAYSSKFLEIVKPHVERLERFWVEDRATKYISEPAKERFLASWDLQKKFKLSSDKDKRELFYDSMRLPVVMETDGGKPSTGVDAVKLSIKKAGKEDEHKELQEAFVEAESAETLVNSFAKPWHDSLVLGRLHPRFNPCGTVSYRLSGFKPYLLNAPFDEKELMSCLKCDEGYEGVHADFASIEPCVTAHYSQDPSLLKVFRDGLGDVYLDLARTLFPGDGGLQSDYNPNAPITSEIKAQFKKQRNIAKIIQLAVQYTGTKYTVSRNLSQSDMPTSLNEADVLVSGYWKHFRKVAVMNESLFLRNIRDGYLRNVVGRIIRVPFPRYKDLPNRFIQSSAHDILSFWVLIIARMCKERRINAKPMILDCHDSTSWQAPKAQVSALEQVFQDALVELNHEIRMTVPVRVEMKRFQTLAGLKGEEK